MALWNQLRARAQDMTTQLKTKTGQFKNKEFANASMAMCALIAAADGSIDNAERAKVSGLITSNEALKVFPAHELTQKFDFYASKLQSNFDFGKLEATQTIAKLKASRSKSAPVVVRTSQPSPTLTAVRPGAALLRLTLAPLVMREHRTQLAVATDPAGATTGLVTLEDLLEELIGEFDDETDAVPTAARRVTGNPHTQQRTSR